MKGSSMKLLIVNADDFGLHPAVNRGIIAGHVNGCISSTSIMPGGGAFEDAAALAAAHPRLGVGVHLTLVGEKPVLDPSEVPSLVDGDGRFPGQYPRFIAGFARGRVNLAEVRKELEAQVEKVMAAGLAVTHLDSHQHLHVLPGVIDITLDIAVRFGIRALRIPAESPLYFGGYPFAAGRLAGRGGLWALAVVAARKARRRGLRAPDSFFGMLAGGNMRLEYLQAVLRALPEGASEIMLHPGDDDNALGTAFSWNYRWQDELAAVTDAALLSGLAERGIKLISFRELADG